MPSINMIATRRAEKHKLAQKTRTLIFGILAEAGLFMVALSFMLVQLVSTQGQVGDLNDKIAKLKPQVEQIRTLEEETAGLQPKVAALSSAKTSTLYLYTAIQNVTDSLSSSTWLSSLSTSGDVSAAPASAIATQGGPAMSISGSSISQSDVGLTMLKMNQFPQFDHVDLNFVQHSTDSTTGPAGAVQFQMSLQLHSLAPKPAAKAAGSTNVQTS